MKRVPFSLSILVIVALATTAPVAATAAEGESSTESVLSSSSHMADGLSLLDDSESESASGLSLLESHPTNFPHRHRRRRRVVRGGGDGGNANWGRMGVYLGIGVLGNFFLDTGANISQTYSGGGGFSILVGARLGGFIALELGYFAAFQESQTTSNSSASISSATLQSIGLDAKVYLAPALRRFEPFLQIGIGAYIMSENFKEELTGVGIDLGGGIDIRIVEHFGIGLRLLYRGFYVDNSDATYAKVATDSAFLNTFTIEAHAHIHF